MQEMKYPSGELNREFFTAEQVKNGGMQRRREALESAGMTFVRAVKIGRNDPCPCGSGMKFKKCHIGNEAAIKQFSSATV